MFNLKRLSCPVVQGLAFAAFVGPGVSQAGTYVSGVTIQSVNLYAGASSQGAYIVIWPALPSGTEGCTYTPANELWIDFSSTAQPDGKTLYATVLAAFLAGRQMTFGVLGCGANGAVPLVYRVDVYP